MNRINKAAVKARICQMAVCSCLLIQVLTGCQKDQMELIEETDIVSEQVAEEPEKGPEKGSEQEAEKETAPEEEQELVYVFLCGAVMAPGVYELPEGSRVYEAISLAGGYTRQADECYLNIARTVVDGEQIYVPRIGEDAEKLQAMEAGGLSRNDSPAGSGGASGEKVNINTASAEVLCTLPGIGQTKANDIIRYRTENGAFQSIEEIKQVSGIKNAVYEKIEEYITI